MLAGPAEATPESDFWAWFGQNDAQLYDFEVDRTAIFDRLSNEMHKVHPSLTFEFGVKKDGKREFVVSADGIREAFPWVERLVAAAPEMEHWRIVAFRPRRAPLDIQYEGLYVHADEVLARLQESGGKIGITLYVPGYSASRRRDYIGVAFLLMDHALGEYDVETKVGEIAVRAIDDADAHAIPLAVLPQAFDKLTRKQ